MFGSWDPSSDGVKRNPKCPRLFGPGEGRLSEPYAQNFSAKNFTSQINLTSKLECRA